MRGWALLHKSESHLKLRLEIEPIKSGGNQRDRTFVEHETVSYVHFRARIRGGIAASLPCCEQVRECVVEVGMLRSALSAVRCM